LVIKWFIPPPYPREVNDIRKVSLYRNVLGIPAYWEENFSRFFKSLRTGLHFPVFSGCFTCFNKDRCWKKKVSNKLKKINKWTSMMYLITIEFLLMIIAEYSLPFLAFKTKILFVRERKFFGFQVTLHLN
jgi:hypothetical protein